MNYRNLKIWKLADEIIVDIHRMTLNEIPRFEIYETGSQIRRSSKSVKSNIVEGFGRRQSKKEFLMFLRYAIASNDETLDHLETLFKVGSLKNRVLYEDLQQKITELGRMLYGFLKAVEKNHRT
jgi:four helix bundle protein